MGTIVRKNLQTLASRSPAPSRRSNVSSSDSESSASSSDRNDLSNRRGPDSRVNGGSSSSLSSASTNQIADQNQRQFIKPSSPSSSNFTHSRGKHTLRVDDIFKDGSSDFESSQVASPHHSPRLSPAPTSPNPHSADEAAKSDSSSTESSEGNVSVINRQPSPPSPSSPTASGPTRKLSNSEVNCNEVLSSLSSLNSEVNFLS
ncbi:unnamed protein product [Mesocestoides corti]|uniref:Uncharacterized protein n=1 Tax=Mesocestoides corti TaxID=53468 RepID=A0A0R3UKR9_MESCO|nr:unnamed protein product [Mesocestoides corti]